MSIPIGVKIDRTLDYVPVMSTITNIIDIALKMIMDIGRIPISEEKHHYFHYLENLDDKGKSYGRCLAALVPVFGNLGVGIYDSIKDKSEESARARSASIVLEVPDSDTDEDPVSHLASPLPSPSSSSVVSDAEESSDESDVGSSTERSESSTSATASENKSSEVGEGKTEKSRARRGAHKATKRAGEAKKSAAKAGRNLLGRLKRKKK